MASASQRSLDISRRSLERMWPGRHCERVHVFANGHVFGMAARRSSIRDNLRGQRSTREHARRVGDEVV